MKTHKALVPYVLFMPTFCIHNINKINQNNSISVITILHVPAFFPTPCMGISHLIIFLKLIIYIRKVTCFHAHIIAMLLEYVLLTT